MYSDSDLSTLFSSSLSFADSNLEDSSSAKSDTEEQCGPIASVFFDKIYFSKADIKCSVEEFHQKVRRNFKITISDKRRLYVRCMSGSCPFRLNFNFRQDSFSPPTSYVDHTCCENVSKKDSVNYLINIPEVQSLIAREGRDTSTKNLKNVFLQLGKNVDYHTIKRCLEKLKSDFFKGDKDQYKYLESYTAQINEKGQFADLEKDNDNFLRLSLIFREGIQGFKYFVDRGMQLDGTHIRNCISGILLVACYKDGSNSVKIIGIAVVSTENESNWLWFLGKIKDRLLLPPSCIISDREKGLINAVKIFSCFHAFCFRHVMENLQTRFKNKNIKKAAWKMAKSNTLQDFLKHEEIIRKLNPNALDWIKSIGYDKLTICFSPVRRYGTITSNNVESCNNRLRRLRKLPIMDMLLEIESMVITDRFKSRNMEYFSGDILTKYAKKIIVKHRLVNDKYTWNQTSENIFQVYDGRKILNVDVSGHGSCSCREPETVGFICSHMELVVRVQNLPLDRFICQTWLKHYYLEAYAPFFTSYPLSKLDELTEGVLLPPVIKKSRGRPRSRRFPSQAVDRVSGRR